MTRVTSGCNLIDSIRVRTHLAYGKVLDAVAQSVNGMLPVLMVMSSNPSRVKPMTYKIDTCYYLAWYLALIVWDKDWLAQYQDNMTDWDIGSWCQPVDLTVGQHNKIAISARCHKSVPVLI